MSIGRQNAGDDWANSWANLSGEDGAERGFARGLRHPSKGQTPVFPRDAVIIKGRAYRDSSVLVEGFVRSAGRRRGGKKLSNTT